MMIVCVDAESTMASKSPGVSAATIGAGKGSGSSSAHTRGCMS